MTKRLMWSLLVAMLVIMIISVLLTVSATFSILTGRQELLLREVVDIIASGYTVGGEDFVERFNTHDYRITIISPTGKIINDSSEDVWYLVTDHEELVDFLSKVIQNDTIISTHTPFMFGELIMAGKCLPDGTVIVATNTMLTFGDTMFEMRYPIMAIAILSLVLAAVIARALTMKILKPLNEIDIETPDPAGAYKEIKPLLQKIWEQKIDLSAQAEELEKSKDEFQAISDSLKEGLILIGSDNTIAFINKAAIKILGMKNTPVMHEKMEILPEEVVDTVRNEINGDENTSFYKKGSHTYRLEATALISNSVRSGTSVLIYDITRQLDMENRRREFSANVSHELKSPLHIICGSAELLKSGVVTKKEDEERFINQIYSESQHMKTLIEDIIRLSKIEESSGEIVKDVIDTYETARTIKENLSQIAEEKSISITVSGCHTRILASESMIYSAVYNLVDNAIKYSDREGKVNITTDEDENTSYIRVSDRGIGIPEEYQDRIFTRFFRVDKSRSKANGGSGLGLAIVKHACLANGGTIAVDSKPGEGTTFTLSFPRYREESTEGDRSSDEPTSSEET